MKHIMSMSENQFKYMLCFVWGFSIGVIVTVVLK